MYNILWDALEKICIKIYTQNVKNGYNWVVKLRIDFLFPYLYFLVLLQGKYAIKTKVEIPPYQYHLFWCINKDFSARNYLRFNGRQKQTSWGQITSFSYTRKQLE